MVISHILVVNHVLMILAPGVIQLTLLNATALDRITRDLARDPRYSSILHLRTGVDTRSSSGHSSTVTQLLGRDLSAQGPSAQASSSQAGASASDESRPPNSPALPVFPGSTEVDWMSSQLGLLSRGHYRMLDDLLSPIGRHLVPVSVAISFTLNSHNFPIIHCLLLLLFSYLLKLIVTRWMEMVHVCLPASEDSWQSPLNIPMPILEGKLYTIWLHIFRNTAQILFP